VTLDKFGNVGSHRAGLTEADIATAHRYAEASREGLRGTGGRAGVTGQR
jgi:hypothetical protein